MQEEKVSEGMLERAIELSADAVLLADAKGKILYTMYREPFNLAKEFQGDSLINLWHPELRGEGEELVSRAARGGVVRDRITGWTSPSGGILAVSVSLAPIDGKESENIVVTAKNISRWAEAEEETSRYIQELVEYAKQVERANQLKEFFTDVMRHDVLNPLSGIKSALSSKQIGEEKKALIWKSVERMENIVSTFSRYVQLESLEEIEFQEGNLSAMLDEAVDTLSPVAESGGIEIVKRYPRELRASFSPSLLEAVTNLLSNAVKYSPSGGEVVVEALEREGELFIKVADVGVGVPDRYKRSIFERFVRGRKEGVHGSGLGLAITKRLAELHSGEAWVEDNIIEVGEAGEKRKKRRGSVFILRILKNLEQ